MTQFYVLFASVIGSYIVMQTAGDSMGRDHETYLDAEKAFRMKWKYNATHVEFEVAVKTLGWFSFGLSPDGNMGNSDVALAWVNDATGQAFLQDYYLTVNKTMHKVFMDLDPMQDWTLLHGSQTASETVIRGTRARTTCDTKMDRAFTTDTLRIIWAYHAMDPPATLKIPKHQKRGAKSVLMFSAPFELVNKSVPLEPDQTIVSILMEPPVAISNNTKSLQHCRLIKLPSLYRSVHLISVKPAIQAGHEQIVQRLQVNLCDERVGDDFGPNSFACFSAGIGEKATAARDEYCKAIMTVWNTGNGDYNYPANAGLLVDPANRFVLMRIHYDNTKGSDILDGSGVHLTFTENLREHNAGILSTGVFQYDYQMSIPPNSADFVVSSYCMDYCTKSTIPTSGITVFSAAVNTHQRGMKVYMRRIRGDNEVTTIIMDENFDPSYQEFRSPNAIMTILPGDKISLDCHYRTLGTKTPVFGGYAVDDEACLGWLMYYPATNLTSCGSMINTRKFLEVMEYVPLITDSRSPLDDDFRQDVEDSSRVRSYYSTKYPWGSENSAKLQRFYEKEDQLGVCLGNGVDILKFAHIGHVNEAKSESPSCYSAVRLRVPEPQILYYSPPQPENVTRVIFTPTSITSLISSAGKFGCGYLSLLSIAWASVHLRGYLCTK